jgi:hypothetical protein
VTLRALLIGNWDCHQGQGGLRKLKGPGHDVATLKGALTNPVAASEKAEDLVVLDDWEDDPVAEPVDEMAGAGEGCDSGSDRFLSGYSTLAEMINQPGAILPLYL